MLIGQRGIRLKETSTGVYGAAQIQNGLWADREFCRQGDRRFALQDPAQEQHDLLRCEMALLKDRVGVEIVGRVTCAAPIDGELAFLGGAKDIRLFHRVAAIRAHQALGVEMVQNPLRAFGWAESL